MTESLLLIAPELYLAVAILALLLFAAWRGDKGTVFALYLAEFALVTTGVLVVTGGCDGKALFDSLVVDGFARFAQMAILAAAFVALLLAPAYLERTRTAKPEYPVLVLSATLGMMLMVAAHDFLSLYVALELQSLSLYVLAAWRRDQAASSEAGLKYFVLGSLASCLLLYGISLVYGYAGTVNFAALGQSLGASPTPVAVAVGMVFVVAGLAFKLAAAPFHMWMPDVIEGAPTPVAAFFATAPKIAALALLTRLLIGPFAGVVGDARQVLLFLSVASMVVGATAGLRQQNIKRLMAYSSIVNVGFLLIGLAVGGVAAVQGMLVYLVLYVAGVFGAFAVILCLRRKGRATLKLSDLAGLGKTHPGLAAAMAVFMFSLAGVPPLAGFFGKYFVLLAAVQQGFAWLAVIGVLMSVVAAAYYLRIVKIMYFDAPEGEAVDPVIESTLKSVLIFAALALVAFVFDPGFLLHPALIAAQSLLL